MLDIYIWYAWYVAHGLMFVYPYTVLFASVYLGTIYILDKGLMGLPINYHLVQVHCYLCPRLSQYPLYSINTLSTMISLPNLRIQIPW